MATKRELLKKMAQLESINDQLVTEITYVDQLMRQVGFTDGLTTVKSTAQGMVDEADDCSASN
jgi:hypothetical protein